MLSHLKKSSSTLLAVLALLITQDTFAGFPSSSGGTSYCFFGCDPTSSSSSTLVFDFNPDNDNGLAPVAINFFPSADNENTGDLCWSGKVKATMYNHHDTGYGTSGTATFDILSSTGQNKGMCFSNVKRTLISTGQMVNSCAYETYQYSLVLKDAVTVDTTSDPIGSVAVLSSVDPKVYDPAILASLLNGQFKINYSGYPTTGAYDECADYGAALAAYEACMASGASTCGSEPIEPKICNIQVGFGVGGDTTNFSFANLFPADTSLSGAVTASGQVYFSDEVLVRCTDSADVGVDTTDSPAIGAKSAEILLSESLSMNAHWCTNAYSTNPDCNASNPDDPTQFATGSIKTAIGDYQQQNTDVTCIDSLDQLRSLSCLDGETAIATCADSTTGYMTFPDSYDSTYSSCSGGEGFSDYFAYSSAQGSGSNFVNLAAIGANLSPGFYGDNTLPPVLPGWTAIVSTPDNQPNHWDFSDSLLINVAYIHTRNNDDTVLGSAGKDNILGGSGADTVDGFKGDDVIQGGDNADTLSGGSGNDLVLGYNCTSVNATCGTFENNGNDDDILYGDLSVVENASNLDDGVDGNDCLDGGRGNDTYTGGGGNDAFVIFENSDSDTVTDYQSGDVIVDMVGGATVKWVKGSNKDSIPSVCEVTSSGNNSMVLEGLSETECVGKGGNPSIIQIVDVANGAALPAQCSGHPFSYQ